MRGVLTCAELSMQPAHCAANTVDVALGFVCLFCLRGNQLHSWTASVAVLWPIGRDHPPTVDSAGTRQGGGGSLVPGTGCTHPQWEKPSLVV